MGVRFSLLITAFIGAYLYLIFNLYNIQLQNGRDYLAQAESQDSAGSFEIYKRGAIYFADREDPRIPAAINKEFPVIYALPEKLADIDAAVQKLAPVMDRDIAELKRTLSAKSKYVPLAKKAPAKQAIEVAELGIEGIYVRNIPERFYPFGQLASQLLGFVSPNDDNLGVGGRYGVEKFYEEHLSGALGAGEASLGKDLVLTIDPNIQREAERLIENLVKGHSSPQGSIIVQDPKTGKILAMANYPNFDPNKYSEAEFRVFTNPTIEQIYEPGSVFKVLTMAAGIDSGKITPDTTFNDTGKLTINGETIRNWDLKAHGLVTMRNVIELSLNTGAAFAEKETGHDTFRKYISAFGFGEKAGVDLPGELRGDIRNIGTRSEPIDFASASFGQGVAVTPLQMINAFSAIANGGKLMRPYVNSEMQPDVIRNVVSKNTASQVIEMMVSAVDKNQVARISGYNVAGKTGTAQKPDLKRGGYTDKVINTYIGFAPASDPAYTVLVKLDEPAGSPLAGQTVVPVFREMLQFVLNYYNVPPDRL